jgi:hypothetical protein
MSKDADRLVREVVKAIHRNPTTAKVATRIQTVAPIVIGISKLLR